MAAPRRRMMDSAALPRLLYIGDVAVADTMAGEALLYRLLQFYPPEKLAVVCAVRPDMPRLPGVTYHHWGPAFPRLLHSRVAEEYILWRAWRYYELPARIAHIATMFRADAILSISHVSGWLAAWQLASERSLPLHLIAHDDYVYANRFPAWARDWAERKFGEAYRAAANRFCISDTMREVYRQRFCADAAVMYPTFKTGGERDAPRPLETAGKTRLTFAYGGSLNSASEIEQVVAFARVAAARGHHTLVYSPQHALLSSCARVNGVTLDAHPAIHSDELMTTLRRDADCLFLSQPVSDQDSWWVATSFPSKWADYSRIGLPLLVWAPPGSSSARFVDEHPGSAVLVTTRDPEAVDHAVAQLEDGAARRSLAERLVRVGRQAFSPESAWQTFTQALRAANHA